MRRQILLTNAVMFLSATTAFAGCNTIAAQGFLSVNGNATATFGPVAGPFLEGPDPAASDGDRITVTARFQPFSTTISQAGGGSITRNLAAGQSLTVVIGDSGFNGSGAITISATNQSALLTGFGLACTAGTPGGLPGGVSLTEDEAERIADAVRSAMETIATVSLQFDAAGLPTVLTTLPTAPPPADPLAPETDEFQDNLREALEGIENDPNFSFQGERTASEMADWIGRMNDWLSDLEPKGELTVDVNVNSIRFVDGQWEYETVSGQSRTASSAEQLAEAILPPSQNIRYEDGYLTNLLAGFLTSEDLETRISDVADLNQQHTFLVQFLTDENGQVTVSDDQRQRMNEDYPFITEGEADDFLGSNGEMLSEGELILFRPYGNQGVEGFISSDMIQGWRADARRLAFGGDGPLTFGDTPVNLWTKVRYVSLRGAGSESDGSVLSYQAGSIFKLSEAAEIGLFLQAGDSDVVIANTNTRLDGRSSGIGVHGSHRLAAGGRLSASLVRQFGQTNITRGTATGSFDTTTTSFSLGWGTSYTILDGVTFAPGVSFGVTSSDTDAYSLSDGTNVQAFDSQLVVISK